MIDGSIVKWLPQVATGCRGWSSSNLSASWQPVLLSLRNWWSSVAVHTAATSVRGLPHFLQKAASSSRTWPQAQITMASSGCLAPAIRESEVEHFEKGNGTWSNSSSESCCSPMNDGRPVEGLGAARAIAAESVCKAQFLLEGSLERPDADGLQAASWPMKSEVVHIPDNSGPRVPAIPPPPPTPTYTHQLQPQSPQNPFKPTEHTPSLLHLSGDNSKQNNHVFIKYWLDLRGGVGYKQV